MQFSATQPYGEAKGRTVSACQSTGQGLGWRKEILDGSAFIGLAASGKVFIRIKSIQVVYLKWRGGTKYLGEIS